MSKELNSQLWDHYLRGWGGLGRHLDRLIDANVLPADKDIASLKYVIEYLTNVALRIEGKPPQRIYHRPTWPLHTQRDCGVYLSEGDTPL